MLRITSITKTDNNLTVINADLIENNYFNKLIFNFFINPNLYSLTTYWEKIHFGTKSLDFYNNYYEFIISNHYYKPLEKKKLLFYILHTKSRLCNKTTNINYKTYSETTKELKAAFLMVKNDLPQYISFIYYKLGRIYQLGDKKLASVANRYFKKRLST